MVPLNHLYVKPVPVLADKTTEDPLQKVVAPDAVTIEVTGTTDKLQAFVKVLEPYGIKELVQSGMVAMGRGGRSITDRALRPVERSA